MKETDLIPESEPGDVSPTAGLMSAQVAMVNLVKYRSAKQTKNIFGEYSTLAFRVDEGRRSS